MKQGHTDPGCSIAFLGMDGVGKSTLAQELERRLTQRGRPVALLSRREYLKKQPDGFVGATITGLYEGSLRTLYGFAGLGDGGTLGERFPPPPADLMARDFEMLLDGAEITSNDPRALTASMLCEIAGHMMFRTAVVLPAVAQGQVVIEDTHGIKMVVKQYLLATSLLAPGDPLRARLDAVLELALELLRPADAALSLAVVVHTDPEIAYERRIRQKGRVGGMEHYGPVGRAADRDSYLDLQSSSQKIFDRIGDRWDCLRADLTDARDQEQLTSTRRAVDDILAAVERLRDGRGHAATTGSPAAPTTEGVNQ
ncbi:nucleoside/nucleotide kinase family protein [Streptomyces parvus]|uniref:hypothetical protein n=1 Tax=Streptomyces parvus TaxID=66428 RepID=UPI003627D5F7